MFSFSTLVPGKYSTDCTQIALGKSIILIAFSVSIWEYGLNINFMVYFPRTQCNVQLCIPSANLWLWILALNKNTMCLKEGKRKGTMQD